MRDQPEERQALDYVLPRTSGETVPVTENSSPPTAKQHQERRYIKIPLRVSFHNTGELQVVYYLFLIDLMLWKEISSTDNI